MPPASRLRDQPAQRVRRIDDVGVGEQEVIRRLRRRLDRLDALLLRPELAGPAGRQRAARNDGEAVRRAERGRGARARPRAVPSLLSSSTRITVNAPG